MLTIRIRPSWWIESSRWTIIPPTSSKTVSTPCSTRNRAMMSDPFGISPSLRDLDVDGIRDDIERPMLRLGVGPAEVFAQHSDAQAVDPDTQQRQDDQRRDAGGRVASQEQEDVHRRPQQAQREQQEPEVDEH